MAQDGLFDAQNDNFPYFLAMPTCPAGFMQPAFGQLPFTNYKAIQFSFGAQDTYQYMMVAQLAASPRGSTTKECLIQCYRLNHPKPHVPIPVPIPSFSGLCIQY
jgi:hypothetical protein